MHLKSYLVYNRSYLHLCLQHLALIILKLRMIKVALSNRSFEKNVTKLLCFGLHKFLFFCVLRKVPIFEPKKILHTKRP